MTDMTDKQIENWRNVLVSYLGPYALIMPKEQVEQAKNRFQEKLDALSEQDDE